MLLLQEHSQFTMYSYMYANRKPLKLGYHWIKFTSPR